MFTIPAFSSQLFHACCRIVGLCICLSGVNAVLAEPATDKSDSSEIAQRVTPANNLQQMQTIMLALDGDEHLWLGENEQQFIGFFRPAIKPATMGIVIVPDSSQQLLGQSFFRRNQQALADQGWSTLSFFVPNPDQPLLPKRSQTTANTANNNKASASQNTESTAAEKSEEPLNDEHSAQKTASQRIDIARQHLLNNQCQTISVMVGNRHISSAIDVALKNVETINGLILWQVDSATLDIKTLKKLAQLKVHVLDIVDNGKKPQWLTDRKRIFARADFTSNYKIITAPTHDIGASHAVRRIRHWLDTQFR